MFNPVLVLLRTCTGIHNPFLNLNLLGLRNNLSARHMSSVTELRDEKGGKNVGEWVGGKPDGKLEFDNKNLIVKVGKVVRKVPLSQFGSREEAGIHGKNLLCSLGKENGKVLNEYRHVKDGCESFLEVKVEDKVIRVDDQGKEVIEKFVWFYDGGKKDVFRKDGNKKIRLEEDLLGAGGTKVRFGKQDGDDFNYRVKNLLMFNVEGKKKK